MAWRALIVALCASAASLPAAAALAQPAADPAVEATDATAQDAVRRYVVGVSGMT